MTTSQHLQIRRAVEALLLSGTPLAGGRIKPGRSREPMVVDVAEEVRVWLHDSDMQERDLSGVNTVWRTQIAVHCLARTAGGVEAEDRADALAQAVMQRMAASGNLGGIAKGIQPSRATWEGEAMDTAVADNLLVFVITHRTARGAF